MTQSLKSAPSAGGDPTRAANPSLPHPPVCPTSGESASPFVLSADEKMSDVLSLLPVDDPSLTDEVTWVPASPLPEEPVQVFGYFVAVRTFDTWGLYLTCHDRLSTYDVKVRIVVLPGTRCSRAITSNLPSPKWRAPQAREYVCEIMLRYSW